jgi:hypothetical protein
MKRIGLALPALLIVAVAILLSASVAFADDGPMLVVGNGGTVRPMKATNIRMAAETVQAIAYSRFAEYRVDFRFENSSGATQTVLLGFPFTATDYGPADAVYIAPAGFRAWQDGRPLAAQLVHGHEGADAVDYYTHKAVFRPGDTTVTVGYLISPALDSGSQSLADTREYTTVPTPPAEYSGERVTQGSYDYTLHTAWYWDGNIDTAVLRWALSPDFIGWGVEGAIANESAEDTSDGLPVFEGDVLYDRIQSTYTTPSPSVYQWTLQDFTPDLYDDNWSPYDIGLHFFAPPTDRWDADAPHHFASPLTRASSSLTIKPYSYPAANLVDGDPSTAWAEGAAGPGIGQWVDVTFPQTRALRELRILPGYAKRPELFAKYNRPKTLRFDYSDGTSSTVTLADSPSLQRFPVSATASRVRVTILDVYAGSTRNETYLSEIDFGQAPAPTFADPGRLLASAKDLPSADAVPVKRIASPISPSPATTTAPAPAENPSPRPTAPANPLGLALLGGTLLGVGVVFWKSVP